MPSLSGNLQGLSVLARRGLERLGNHQTAAGELACDALVVRMCALAADLGRQVGVLIGRDGTVEHILIGSDRALQLPDLGRWGRESGRLRGLRLVHVHLKGEPVDADDLNDLVRLGLDLVAAITLQGQAPHLVSIAQLAVDGNATTARASQPADVVPWQLWHGLTFDCAAAIAHLEGRLAKVRPPARLIDARERALLVHVGPETVAEAENRLLELEELCRTAHVEVVGRVVQRRRQVDGRTLIGSGKLAEIAFQAAQVDATILVFGRELTPSQSKAIALGADTKVLDRTQLILDIFARRARSQDGKLQVELAQLRYSLPRLGDRDNSLSRLTGGIGATGPGETKLEVDRRRCRDRVGRIETQLAKIKAGRGMRRANRATGGVTQVALLGYTNVGKSSLLNALTKSSAFTENLLFATLDPTTRHIRLPGGTEAVLTDTVGFIRDLPKELLGAFEATLEEAEVADLLVVIVDGAHRAIEAQLTSVLTILRDHGLAEKPRRIVVNKADAIADVATVREIARNYGALLVSSQHRLGLLQLLEALEADALTVAPPDGALGLTQDSWSALD
ncbi:MAG: GTPase HflX [Myxococcales bacterium]|nr:GTPase HflX [Myxococcales bacterium]